MSNKGAIYNKPMMIVLYGLHSAKTLLLPLPLGYKLGTKSSLAVM
jgi:hypothetical protein